MQTKSYHFLPQNHPMAPYLGNSEVLTQDQKRTEHLLSHFSVGLPTKWAVGISQARATYLHDWT